MKNAPRCATLIDDAVDLNNAIIFCNRKLDVGNLWKSLDRHGYSVGALHGDMDQTSRTATLKAFKDNKIKLLVASDVAARGLDIPDVSHVFNYDVAVHAEDYVHRIGRTGRAGRKGAAFMIVTPLDQKGFEAIEVADWRRNRVGRRQSRMECKSQPQRQASGQIRQQDSASTQGAKGRGKDEPAKTASHARQTEAGQNSETRLTAVTAKPSQVVTTKSVRYQPCDNKAAAKPERKNEISSKGRGRRMTARRT